MFERFVLSITRTCRYSITIRNVQMITSERIHSTSMANFASVANMRARRTSGTAMRAANPRRTSTG